MELDELSRQVNTLRTTAKPLGWRLLRIELDDDARSVTVATTFKLPPRAPNNTPATKG